MLDLLKDPKEPIDLLTLEHFTAGVQRLIGAQRELEQYRQRERGRERALIQAVEQHQTECLRVAADDPRLTKLLKDAGLSDVHVPV